MAIAPANPNTDQAATDKLIQSISGDDQSWYRNTAPTRDKFPAPQVASALPQARKPSIGAMKAEQARQPAHHHTHHQGHHHKPVVKSPVQQRQKAPSLPAHHM